MCGDAVTATAALLLAAFAALATVLGEGGKLEQPAHVGDLIRAHVCVTVFDAHCP